MCDSGTLTVDGESGRVPEMYISAAADLASAGKNLRCVSPSSSAASISLAVAHPGTIGTSRCVAHSTTRGLVPGEMWGDVGRCGERWRDHRI